MRILLAVIAILLAFLPAGAESEAAPLRAAFYYAGEPVNWIPGDRYSAVLGEYDPGDPAVIAAHVDMLEYAGITVGLYSWWGRGSPTDSRFRAHLDAGLKWAVYYELDHDGSRPGWLIRSDMRYLRDHYFNHPNYLHIDGKPVVFVYAPLSSCTGVSKWTAVRNHYGLYVNHGEVPNWWTCNSLDSWHGYRPDERLRAVYVGSTVYSMSVSAGFWSAWEETPRLARDFAEFAAAIQVARSYNPQWELYYFNEFGEGTQIEPSDARCEVYLCADYLEAIR